MKAIETGLKKRSINRLQPTTSDKRESNVPSSHLSNRQSIKWRTTTQWLHTGFILFTSACLIWLSYWGWSHEPKIILDNEASVGYFSAERAFRYVDHLSTQLGPRAFGTRALERSQNYIWQQLEKISQYANDHSTEYSLQLEYQTVSGTHITQRSRRSLRTSSYTYQNVTNIIAILCLKDACNLQEERDRSLLVVNGHVDSAISSPGANDDAVACGVMLELLFSWIRSPNRNKLKHPVIFLFNGAEETFLNGAHGFVTGWQWIRKVGALLNLESSGSGGLALLFRSGPKNTWLSRAYAKAVTRPHTSVVAQDIFEKELIPSETDFRVFWEFASIPGIDLANYIHGETYHTYRDAIDRVSLGFVQHMGDSATQIMEQLVAKEDMIVEAYPYSSNQNNNNAIYYDVLGLVTIFGMEKYWNMYFVLLLFLAFHLVLKRITSGLVDYKLVLCFYPVWIVSCCLTLAVSVSFGWFLHSFCRRSMSWYGRVWLAEWIYGSLGLALMMKLLPFLFSRITSRLVTSDKAQSRPLSYDSSTIYEPIWLSYMLFEVTLLVLFLSLGLRMSYLPAWDVLCSIIACRLWRDKRWHSLVGIIHFIPIAIFRLPCGYMAIAAFVPIMGRIGDRLISDMIIAGLCCLFTVLASFPLIISCMSYSIPFYHIKRLVVALFCCSLYLVAITKIPYSDNYPKRLHSHYIRVMDTNGKLEKQGLFIRGFDARKVSSVGWYNDMPSIQSLLNETEFEWGYMHSNPWNENKERMVRLMLPLTTPLSNATPRLDVLEDVWKDDGHQQQRGRCIRVKLSFPGGNMASFSFNASLLSWSLSKRLPYPNSKGFITVRHLRCHDCNELEFSFTTEDRNPIAFDLVNILLSPEKEQIHLESRVPSSYVAWSHLQSYCSSFLIPRQYE